MNRPALEAELAAIVEQAFRGGRMPGLSVAVSVNGRRSAANFGTLAVGSGVPMTPTARFQIGCITKVLTCMVAMQLAHQGRIDLDGAIVDYLPDLAAIPSGRDIRVRHLGTHTSGYRGLNPSSPEHGYFYSWEKFADFLRGTPQIFPPGSVFNYEHTECVILGEVIRQVSGSSCAALTRDLIIEPLQLAVGSIERDGGQPEARVADHSLDRGTGQFKPVRAVPYCSFWASSLSAMTASTMDLVMIGEVLGGLRSVPGICRQAIDDVVRQAVELPRSAGGPEREISPRSFGFGCAQYADGIFGHNGSARGQTCGLRFSPRHGVVVAVALNCWDPYARDSLLDSVLGALIPDAAAESDVPRIGLNLHPDELQGTYAGCVQGVEIVVTRSGDGLLCAITGLGGGGHRLNIEMTIDAAGELRARFPIKHLSAGFFREESTGAPAMLVGLNAFKKVS